MACIATLSSATAVRGRAALAEVHVSTASIISPCGRRRSLAPATTLCLTGFAAALASAQPSSSAPAAVPSIAPLGYVSVFSHYRPLRDEPATPWRAANDTVNRIGGWRAYAREAQTPAPIPAPGGKQDPRSTPPAVQPAADPHAGHRSKP